MRTSILASSRRSVWDSGAPLACVAALVVAIASHAASAADATPQTLPAVSLFPAEMGREHTLPVISESLSWGIFWFSGDAAVLGDKVELVLDLPAGFEAYSRGDPQLQNVLKDDRQIVRMDVTKSARRIQPDKVVRDSITLVWLKTAAAPSDDETVRFHLETDGETYSPKEMKLRILPPFAERPEPEFVFTFIWNVFDGKVPEAVWEDAYQLFRNSGINMFPTGATAYEELGPYGQFMDRRYRSEGGKFWATVPSSYVYPPKEWKQRYMSTTAFTHFVADGAMAFDRIDRGRLASSRDRLDAYLWDLERYHAGIRPHSEDPATVRQFAEWSGRDVADLTPEFIEQSCAEEFETFREWQFGQTIRNFADWVHSHNPEIQAVMCAGSRMPNPGHEDQRWWQDADVVCQPMIYSDLATYERILAKDMQLLPGRPFMSTFWNAASLVGELPAAYGPRNMRQRLIITAALGAIGVMHYPGAWLSHDAEYFWYYGKAMNEVAMAESFYRQGRKVDDIVSVKGLAELAERIPVGKKELVIETPNWRQQLSTYAHLNGVETLVTMLNRNPDKDAFVRVAMPECARERYSVCDAVTRERIVPDAGSRYWWQSQLQDGILVKVAAEDVRFVLISPRPFGFETAGQVVAAETEAQYAAACEAARASGKSAGVLTENGITIGYDDRHEDGNVQTMASTPAQQVWFDEVGGKIVGWTVGKDSPAWIEPQEDNGFALDRFWMPKAAWSGQDHLSRYELIGREIDGNVASVKWHRALGNSTLDGCTLTKTFVVHADEPVIDVEIEISARGVLLPVEFSYWSHSFFGTGETATRFEYEGPDGVVAVSSARLQNLFAQVAGLDASEAIPTIVDRAEKIPAAASWMSLAAPEGQGRVRVDVDQAALGQLYRWAGTGGRVTMEWMSRMVRLEVGEAWKARYSIRYLQDSGEDTP